MISWKNATSRKEEEIKRSERGSKPESSYQDAKTISKDTASHHAPFHY